MLSLPTTFPSQEDHANSDQGAPLAVEALPVFNSHAVRDALGTTNRGSGYLAGPSVRCSSGSRMHEAITAGE